MGEFSLYPNDKTNYVVRLQNIINAYYDNYSNMYSEDTYNTNDDMDRLMINLSTLSQCVNEYVLLEFIKNETVDLPDDDIQLLLNKHTKDCQLKLNNARKSLKAIDKYSSLMAYPHLFTKSECENLDNDEYLKNIIITIITDIYDENKVDFDTYIKYLYDNDITLDNQLLSLDYA